MSIADFDYKGAADSSLVSLSAGVPGTLLVTIVNTYGARFPFFADYYVSAVNFAVVNATGHVVAVGSTSLDITVTPADLFVSAESDLAVTIGKGPSFGGKQQVQRHVVAGAHLFLVSCPSILCGEQSQARNVSCKR